MRAGRFIILALAGVMLTGPALAEVPWHSLFPRPRPATLGGAPVVAAPVTPLATDRLVSEALATVTANAAGLERSLRPPPRPPARASRFAQWLQRRLGGGGSNSAPQAPAPQTVAAAETGEPARSSSGRGGLCGRSTLEGERIAPVRSSTQGCGIADPVRVTAVRGIPLSQPNTLDCDTARALDTWVQRGMLPAVGRRGGGVARINTAPSYSCRTRNSQPGARISEHGRGRAVDIMGYRLQNGETVTVLEDWRRGEHRDDLREMHAAACGTFRTTLSPDSDRFHQDHFHFDLAQHRGGGTYCR